MTFHKSVRVNRCERTFLQPGCCRGPFAKVKEEACLFPSYGSPNISSSTERGFDSGGFIEQPAGTVTSCFGKYKIQKAQMLLLLTSPRLLLEAQKRRI